jgi:hypothetical protein
VCEFSAFSGCLRLLRVRRSGLRRPLLHRQRNSERRICVEVPVDALRDRSDAISLFNVEAMSIEPCLALPPQYGQAWPPWVSRRVRRTSERTCAEQTRLLHYSHGLLASLPPQTLESVAHTLVELAS